MTIDTSVTAIPRRDKSADRLRQTLTITGPASYATGGDAFSLINDLGWKDLHVVAGGIMRQSGGGATIRIVALNRDTAGAPKLQWYDLAGNEIANGTDLSAYSGSLELIGQ